MKSKFHSAISSSISKPKHTNRTMKSPKFLTGLLALAFASPAFGLTFEITGATAFRRATIESISALYAANGGTWRFVHNRATAADYLNADFITYEGTITGLPGTTVIRCAFNGSVEGLRAIAQPGSGDASYFKLSALTIPATVAGANQFNVSTSGNVETAQAEMAFSDTDVSISPYAASSQFGFGSSPGVVVFGLVVSEGCPITNVTTQQYNSLLKNGYVPLSNFTGVATDTSKVFCTGRNDGSGTRSSYLSEMGYGVANPVNQFLVVGSNGNQITALQKVPVNGTNDIDPLTAGVQLDPATDIASFDQVPGGAFNQVTQLTTSLSTVWGQNIAGNGGAFSGSVLRGHLALDGDSVTVFDEDGYNLFGTPQINIGMVSWVSLNDAVTARINGATLAGFNGVSLAVTDADPEPGGTFIMTAADKAKIYRGAYSAWNFQKFYYRTGSSAETVTLYNSIFTSVASNLGAAGLKNIDMKVGRTDDGGIINPF